MRKLLTGLLAAALILPLAAQEPEDDADPSLQDLQAFVQWMGEYEKGAIRLMKELMLDEEVLADADQRMQKLAAWNNLAAAKQLFRAATVDPRPAGARSSSDNLDFQAELMPWKIRALARKHLAAMELPELDEWLRSHLASGKLRDDDGEEARRNVDAALQILGARGTTGGKLELVKAVWSMPPQLRLRAIDVLSTTADIGLVPTFLDKLKDKDDDVRIAAVNALGTAMAPHTDETTQTEIPEDVAKTRDEVIDALQKVLQRDRVWQVRAAAAQNLAKLKSRFAIPALIEGYDQELRNKKDPWAMDTRLHRLLEGMTGMSIPPGSAKPWRDFWKNEGASFRFAAAGERASQPGDNTRYSKFFRMDLDSDRLLFIVDFSGSMQEPITLSSGTTSTKAGETTTKAKLVVDELRRIVMSLPDGSYFNVVVFSDGVRVWRPTRGGQPELVRLTDETRDDLLGSFLSSIEPRGPTNLYGALDTAIGFAGRGLHDKHYALGFDTVYVLSDGAPSYGPVTDKDEIRRLVRETNRLKRLTIHCVTFGAQNDTDFLRLLAEENGGRHIHVD